MKGRIEKLRSTGGSPKDWSFSSLRGSWATYRASHRQASGSRTEIHHQSQFFMSFMMYLFHSNTTEIKYQAGETQGRPWNYHSTL